MSGMFFQIATIIIVSTFFAYIARLLKQPFIPVYIITGLMLGPVLKLVTDVHAIATLSEIGVAFLLFVVGLEIEIDKLKNVGRVIIIGSVIQITFLFLSGFLMGNILHFTFNDTIYLAFLFSFSSTMVVVKILSDKGEINTLHGKIIIGILLVEDFFAILALSVLKGNVGALSALGFSLVKGVLLVASALFFTKVLFPQMFGFAARNSELLFSLSLSVCFGFAIVAYSLGFSIAIGAFLAGITLANLPYNLEIIARIKPLRDFFSILFFATLGMELTPVSVKSLIGVALLIISVFIIIKFFIVSSILMLFRYTRRTAILTAMSLLQISEFSLILIDQGFKLGQISQNLVAIAIITAIITITLSTYFMNYDTKVYSLISKPLSYIKKLPGEKEEEKVPAKSYSAILIGLNRIGYGVVKTLKKIHESVIVIDYNPDVIKRLKRWNVDCLYADIGDSEIVKGLNVEKTRIVVSTVSDMSDNVYLIQKLREKNPLLMIIVTAETVDDALELYSKGADYVIVPRFLGGQHVSMLIDSISSDVRKLLAEKINHIRELKARKKRSSLFPA